MNRLARESSPYLLLHRDNPVDWYPWGEEALARARREERPIFLSVGYSTCYWCHVMERESFSDPEVAGLMNREFVNIKLDREERPDLDEIYMTATQVLTQHGGWPNSVFLTPELEPFFAGTYFPPEDRAGMPGFKRVLHSMAEAWKGRRPEVLEQARGVTEAIRRYLEERAQPGAQPPRPEIARRSFDSLARRFDPDWGGFGGAPKFPTPSNLLLLEELAGEEPSAARMLTRTLDQMARGGIYDQLGGGFHRYATDGEWKIPHFEKMLYDNGLLLELYAREWAREEDPEMARVARETVGWLERELSSPEGAFQAALDAETDGVEGAFYVWTADELRAVLGVEDFGFLAPLYGFDGAPFFEGRHYVLHLPRPLAEQADKRKTSLAELLGQIEPLRARLFEARRQRQPVLTDRKILTDWNGMAIAGVAEAGRLLPEPAFVARASRAAEGVLELLRPGGELLHVKRGEQRPVAALLSDYVFLVRGLLALDRAAPGEGWLALAADLTAEQIDRLEDPEGGFFTAAASDQVLCRSKEAFDGATPAANAIAALNLIELGERTGEERWREAAARTLRAFAGLVEQLPDGARTLALAARRYATAFGSDLAVGTRPAAAGQAAAPGPVTVSASWRGEPDADGWRGFAVTLEIADGWHVYGRSDAPVTSIDVASADGELRDLAYPGGDGELELDGRAIEVHTGTTVIEGAARVASGGLALEVSFQPCDATRCLAPVTRRVGLAP